MVTRRKPLSAPQRSLHDEIIAKLLKPIWLENDSLLDNLWIINLHGERLPFDFDKAITPWPNVKSLLHVDFELDLITAKLLVFYSLKPPPLGWNAAVLSVQQTLRSYIYLVRWRAENGLASNSLLTPEWFDVFDRGVKKAGRDGLVPFASRAVSVFDAYDRGDIVFEINERNAISAPTFARLLGIDDYRTFPKNSKQIIEELLDQRNLHVSRAPVRKGRTAKGLAVEALSLPSDEDESVELGDDASVVGGKLTRDAARVYYKVWLDLWRIRDKLLHDPIGYRAFNGQAALAHFMDKSGLPKAKATEDAPPRQTSCLINSALTLVIDPVSDGFIDVVESLMEPNATIGPHVVEGLNARLNELGFSQVKPVYFEPKGTGPEDALTIHDFVFKILPASAKIIMATYSARRDDELNKTKTGCIELDSHGDHWLHCFINKNLNQMDRIPVPRSVARAVELVSRIRALGRKAGNKLFDFACPILRRAVKFDIRAIFNKVRDFFNVPLLDDGTAWSFKPHQFRKFFGVTYYWRWAFPDLTALTLQYRHFNPDVTRAYIEMKGAEALRMRDEKLAAAARQRDVERKLDFDSGHRDFVAWVVRGVAEGKRLAGAMGKRINEMIDSLSETFSTEIDVTVTAPDGDSFDQALERLIDSISMSTHPEGHSICCMGSKIDPIRQQQVGSQCLNHRQRVTGQLASTSFSPDLGYAVDTACAVCPLRARLPEMMPYWHQEARKASEALKVASGTQWALLDERAKIITEFA